MILDSEEQRSMLIEIINKSVFPGDSVDRIYALKKSVENAEVSNALQNKTDNE